MRIGSFPGDNIFDNAAMDDQWIHPRRTQTSRLFCYLPVLLLYTGVCRGGL